MDLNPDPAFVVMAHLTPPITGIHSPSRLKDGSVAEPKCKTNQHSLRNRAGQNILNFKFFLGIKKKNSHEFLPRFLVSSAKATRTFILL